MTFAELITAVHRDVATIDPTACVKVEWSDWHHGCGVGAGVRQQTEYRIWLDKTRTHYVGATPDEAYGEFVAAVMPVPAHDEALALCDTPASRPDVTAEEVK